MDATGAGITVTGAGVIGTGVGVTGTGIAVIGIRPTGTEPVEDHEGRGIPPFLNCRYRPSSLKAMINMLTLSKQKPRVSGVFAEHR